jgi:hypothetical protein
MSGGFVMAKRKTSNGLVSLKEDDDEERRSSDKDQSSHRLTFERNEPPNFLAMGLKRIGTGSIE